MLQEQPPARIGLNGDFLETGGSEIFCIPISRYKTTFSNILVRKYSLKLYFLVKYYVFQNDVFLGNGKYTLTVRKGTFNRHFSAEMKANRFLYQKNVKTFFLDLPVSRKSAFCAFSDNHWT